MPGLPRNNSRYYLSNKTRKNLRNYSHTLFHSNKQPLSKRRYVFYLLINKELDWIRETLLTYDLETHEVESEIYILTSKIFKKFNPEISGIVPYTEKAIVWESTNLFQRMNRYIKEEENKEVIEDDLYEIDTEFYLRSPNFIFENKWLAKDLSQSQKNLILKILTVDSPSVRNLANKCRFSKSTIATQLQNIAAVLKGRL